MKQPKPQSEQKKKKDGNWFWDFINSGEAPAEFFFYLLEFLYKVSSPVLLEGLALIAETTTLILTLTAETLCPLAELFISFFSSF